jgi:hypothetical protein
MKSIQESLFCPMMGNDNAAAQSLGKPGNGNLEIIQNLIALHNHNG